VQRHCDFCSKTLSLFSRSSEEAQKDGLCLCKQCYESLWKDQPNPINQAKKLAEIALKNRLKPETKKIVVKRVKELASEERKNLDEISAFESNESTNTTTSQEDKSVNVSNTPVKSEKEKDGSLPFK
jgi:hypothetical protein